MKYLRVYQRDVKDGKSRFEILETNDDISQVYYSYYGDVDKQIKVYKVKTDVFELYFKNEHTMNKIIKFLMLLGYNDEVDTTPTSTYYVHINLAIKYALLVYSNKPIRDHEINWEDTHNHIYAYRDISDIHANVIKVYFRNYKTAKRWLNALELIGFGVNDTVGYK